jgi:hypothetical protein
MSDVREEMADEEVSRAERFRRYQALKAEREQRMADAFERTTLRDVQCKAGNLDGYFEFARFAPPVRRWRRFARWFHGPAFTSWWELPWYMAVFWGVAGALIMLGGS